MMLNHLYLLAFLMVDPTPTPSPWPQEPGAFRGVQWGASEAEITAKINGLTCDKFPSTLADRGCIGLFQIGNDPEMSNVFTIKQDRLISVTLLTKSSNFEALRAALVERYGPPSVEARTPIRTTMNVEYQNDQLSWFGEHIVLTLDRFHGDVNSSIASFFDRAAVDEGSKAMLEKRKRDAEKF